MNSSMLKTIGKIKFTSDFNSLLFTLKKLPILKKIIKNSIYKNGILKKVFYVISIFLEILKKICLSLFGILFIFILFGLAKKLNNGLTEDSLIINVLFFYILFNSAIVSVGSCTNADEWDYIFLKVFRLGTRDYYINTIITKHLIQSVLFFIIGLLLFKDKLAMISYINLIVSFYFLKVIFDTIYIYIYDKTIFNGLKLTTVYMVVLNIISILLLIMVVTKYSIPLNNLMKLPVLPIVLMFFAYKALKYLKNSEKLDYIKHKVVNYTDIEDTKKILKEANFTEAKMDKEDYNIETVEKADYSDKNGYEYLHSLFLSRFKKKLEKPFKNRVKVLLAIGLVVSVAGFFAHRFNYIDTENINLLFRKSGPQLVAIYLYIMQLGEKFIKILFYNMDSTMLKYRYYREPASIEEMLKYRIKTSVLLNFPIGLLVAFTLAIIFFLSGGTDILAISITMLTAIVLSILFSFHYLIMYYLLQPFTNNMEIKNPIYSFTNFLIYFICILSMQFSDKVGKSTILILVIFTIIYIPIGLYLLKKFGSKNFRLRN